MPESTTEPRQPQRSRSQLRRPRRRRTVLALVIVAALAATAAFTLRTPSPVGHWDSAEGLDRYLAAYDEAFAELPPPDATLDVRTEYGTVRVYRFAATNEQSAESVQSAESTAPADSAELSDAQQPAADPLVLVPGRSSGVPVWADNVPSLRQIADVYALDLLGEPGRSVQERPLDSDADQAAWLDETLAQLPEERFHLVGLSIGGWSAVNLAVHSTAHVSALTVLDPPFVFDDIPIGTVLRTIPVSVPWAPRAWRDEFSSYTAGGAPVEDVPVARMIEAGMQHYRLRVPAPTRITEDQLESLDVPVLALLAGQSVMNDPDAAATTATRVLGHESVRVYPDASHALNGEYPQEIADDISEFIRTLP